MSAFSSLQVFLQTLIPLLLFVEAVLELGLFIYQLSHHSKSHDNLPSLVIFVFLLALLFSVTQGDPFEGKDAFLLNAPWLIFITVILLGIVHFAFALTREYRRRKNMLSPFSVKDATDKLPMGLCFADPNGRIVLCNDRMRRLSFVLSGHEFQITEDLEKALEYPDKRIIVNGDCYILPDKTVWQFRKQHITVDNDENWLQMTAHNVTELYNGNVRQTAINDELKEVNRKLQKMYERMADDIKEKEMEASDIHFSPANLVKMIQMIESGAINRKVAKKVFEAIFDEDVDPEVYVEENGLKTVNDEGALRKVIEEIVANNPKSVEDYKAGKKKAMGFFVGQTMRAMKGKADPAMVNQILKEILD